MARTTNPLTNNQIKNAKPKEKKYKLSDGRGLFIIIAPNGSKFWRLKYRFKGKEKEYAIGTYPTITLQSAREKREKLKKLIAENIDPNEEKRQKIDIEKKEELKKENTFYTISQKWHTQQKSQVSANYHHKLDKALENYTYKIYKTADNTKLCIKNKPIDEITRKEIITILEELREQGLNETARRNLNCKLTLDKLKSYRCICSNNK
jgi:hypothetical protein